MDTFEIRDEEINVEEIMQKIRENIKRRKENGAYPDDEAQILGQPEEQTSLCQRTKQAEDKRTNDLAIWDDGIKRDLEYINSNWDIQNNSYLISSHRPYMGKFLIKGRELVHGEVKRYVDPMIWKQEEFNSRTVRILNEITRKISDIEQIGFVRSEIKNEISAQVRAIAAAMNQDIEKKACLANMLDKKIGDYQNIQTSAPSQELGLNYFLFEEQFCGSRADIKHRQTDFLPFFEGCKKILDIGCGRGEFLELLKNQGKDGKGVDVDENMVSFCKSKGLDVELNDAISYLKKVEDESLDGIFIDQVVEHLEPDYLIKMLNLCYKKLNCGGILLADTVNPLSFFSLANFWIDMSHKRPVHPDTLRFLLSAAGFREIDIKYLSPVPEEMQLKKVNIEGSNDGDKRLLGSCNYNIDILNKLLFGAQDYMVVGKR